MCCVRVLPATDLWSSGHRVGKGGRRSPAWVARPLARAGARAERERCTARLARARFDSTFFFFVPLSLFNRLTSTNRACSSGRDLAATESGMRTLLGEGEVVVDIFLARGEGPARAGRGEKKGRPRRRERVQVGAPPWLALSLFFHPALSPAPSRHTHTHAPPAPCPSPGGASPWRAPCSSSSSSGTGASGCRSRAGSEFCGFFFCPGICGSTPGRRIGRPPPRPAGLAGLRARAHARIVRRGR